MAGEFSGAAAGLNVGTLTINLALNTGDIKRGMDALKKDTANIAAVMQKEWAAAGGALGKFGSGINEIRESTVKMFGEKAPAALQKFGKELAVTIGFGKDQVVGLDSAVTAMGAAFKVAGTAIGMMSTPLGVLMIMLGALVAAWGALKKAMSTKGWAPEFMDEPWFQSFKPGATPAGKGVDFSRSAPGPKGSQGQFFNPQTGQYSAASAVTAVPNPGPGIDVGKTLEEGIWDPLTESFSEGLKSLEPLMKKLRELLAPPEDKGKGKGKASAAKEQAEEEKRRKKETEEVEQERAKWLADHDASSFREKATAAETMQREWERSNEQQLEGIRWQEEQQAKRIDDEERAMKQAGQARLDKWAALGSGQIGTATGTTGIGGAAMNIVGGAASQHKLTGSVMQGAAAGGQAGGPWGALIGAIIALATHTQSFTKLMGAIEGVLEGILPILDVLLRPIMEFVDSLVDGLKPLLKIIMLISDVLSQALKPIWSLFEVIGTFSEAIGSLIDAINIGGLTGALDKSLGSEKDQWGKYTANDWLTVIGPVIGELGYEIDKAANKGVDKESRAEQAARQFAGPSADFDSMMAAEEQKRRDAWDMNPLNPYRSQNIAAQSYFDIQEALNAAKNAEVEATEEAAEALRQLSDELYNAAPGFKVAASIFNAQDMVGYTGPTGNPF